MGLEANHVKMKENKYQKITTQWCTEPQFCLHLIVHPLSCTSSYKYPAHGTLRPSLRVGTLRDKNLKSPNRHPILLGSDSICSKSYRLMARNIITASAIRITVFNEICCDMIVI
jgi:hypothetical protein